MRKPKLLWISDDPNLNSGNGKFTRNVLGYLKEDFEITSVIGWNGIGQRHSFPYHIWPVDLLKRKHEELGYLVMMVVNQEKPDVIVGLGDVWDFWFLPKLKMSGVRKIGYITVDVHPLRPEWDPIWESLDTVAVPSEWGKEQIDKQTPVNAEVIYEGVDPEIFKPLQPEERNARRQNLKSQCAAKGLWDPKFLVAMLARPMIRKNLPAGIRAIARVGDKYRDLAHVVLYSLEEIEPGANNMKQYNARHLPPLMPKVKEEFIGPRSKLSDADIAGYLGMSDVLLFPSMHEGFGLPLLEAMACGCVPIAANATTSPELLGNGERGLLAKVGATFVDPSGMEEELVEDEDLASKLEYLHNNPGKLKQLRENGIAWAREQTWEKTAGGLKKMVLGSLDRKERPVYLKEV